jgi:hypothetical protein
VLTCQLLEVKRDPKNAFMLLSTMVGIRCVKMRHELCAKVATGRNVRTMYDEVPPVSRNVFQINLSVKVVMMHQVSRSEGTRNEAKSEMLLSSINSPKSYRCLKLNRSKRSTPFFF